MPLRNGIINKVYVMPKHAGPGKPPMPPGSWESRKWHCAAYMTLLAETDKEYDIWLQSNYESTTGTIVSQIRKYEKANKHLIGKRITYLYNGFTGMKFFRSIKDTVEDGKRYEPINPWKPLRDEHGKLYWPGKTQKPQGEQ